MQDPQDEHAFFAISSCVNFFVITGNFCGYFLKKINVVKKAITIPINPKVIWKKSELFGEIDFDILKTTKNRINGNINTEKLTVMAFLGSINISTESPWDISRFFVLLISK